MSGTTVTDAVASKPRPRLDHAWLRWTASLMLVVACHGAALLTLRRTIPALGTTTPEPIMIDLAAEPVAPPEPPAPTPEPPAPRPPEPAPPDPIPPAPTPPEPAQAEPAPTDPNPPEPAALPIPDTVPPVPQAEVPLPPSPPPRPRLHPRPHPPITQPAIKEAPTTPPAAAAPATPPAPAVADAPASAPKGQTFATWEGKLVAHIARFKRFPAAALRRGEQGIVLMRLVLAHGGAVLSMAMVRGSGYADLDEEAKAWMTRAQPLPAVPPEITAQQLEIVVPLHFTLR